MFSFNSRPWKEDYGGKQLALRPICTSKKTGTSSTGRDEGDLLSPISRMFHHPNCNLYVMAIMGWKTQLKVEVLKANLVHTLLKHPRFSSLQVTDSTKSSGKMRWVPVDVDLDNHMVIPDLDPNMDSPDEFVEDYISNISKTQIDMSKPLWDLHILNVKTSKAETVSILRMHHSLGDGVSLISVLLACTRQTDVPSSLPSLPSRKTKTSLSRKDFWQYLGKFWLFLRILLNTIVDVLMLIATAIFLKDSESPIRVPTGSRPTHVRVIHRTVALEDVKFVKNAMHATVNDVVLGVTQAALSRYLNRRYVKDEEQEKAKMRNKIPKGIRFRAAVLTNLRPALEIDAAAAFYGRIPSQTTMAFSNVAGPREEISFFGHPMEYLAVTCYGQPHGLMIHVLSYASQLTFTISVDERIIPDPHQLGDDVVESLELIKNAVLTRETLKMN